MICSICKKSNHDRKYCPTIFCEQIINEIFDIAINESISTIPLNSSDISIAVFMSQHRRLGQNSILKLLDPELLSIIISYGDIVLYKTTTCPVFSTQKMIQLERVLKNTKNTAVSNIIEDKGNIYTVSCNNVIKSYTETTTLIHGKKNIIHYLDVRDKIVVCVMNIYAVNDEYLNLVIYTKDNFRIIFHYLMKSQYIFNPYIVDDMFLYIVNKNGKIKKFDISTNKLIWKYKLHNEVISTYYHSDHYNLYIMTDSDRVHRINLKTMRIESSSTPGEKSIIVFHVDNTITYTIYNNRSIVSFDKDYKNHISYTSNSIIDFAPIIINLYEYIITTHKYKTIKYMIGTHTYKWMIHLRSEITYRPIVNIDKTYMYVSTTDSYVHKISIQHGKIMWSVKARGKIIGNMVIKGKYLFIQTTNPSNLYKVLT